MLKRQTIIDAARTLLGTPHQHLGRSPEKAIDCIGHLVLTAQAVGAQHQDMVAYKKRGTGSGLILEMDKQIKFGWEIVDGQPGYQIDMKPSILEPGNVVVLWIRSRKQPTHCGILSTLEEGHLGLIHTYSGGPSKVVEHNVDSRWEERIVKSYRFPEVEPWQP